MSKLFGFAIFILQLIGFQADVLSSGSEKTTYIEYASGWTGPGIASDITAKLSSLHKSADKGRYLINVKDIKISPEWGYAFIIYEVSDRTDGIKPAATYIEYASGWTGSGLTGDISDKLDALQRTAKKRNALITIKDIKLTPEWGYAFIIYEMTESS